jgi:hypothetical protein
VRCIVFRHFISSQSQATLAGGPHVFVWDQSSLTRTGKQLRVWVRSTSHVPKARKFDTTTVDTSSICIRPHRQRWCCASFRQAPGTFFYASAVSGFF